MTPHEPLGRWAIWKLLTDAKNYVNTKPKHAKMGAVFWYPDRRTQHSPRFVVVQGMMGPPLRWEDIWNVLSGLETFYNTRFVWTKVAFSIEDSERGTLGSGIIREASRGGDPGTETS